jgi:hypothetical protein
MLPFAKVRRKDSGDAAGCWLGQLLIHTWLQPGDRGFQKKAKPFKRFRELALTQFTWLKPGVK